jgi:ElaB/YqjD/DUF883 family membrane-anchored ribosome-binding protein
MNHVKTEIKSDITNERLFEEFNTVVAETEKLLKSLAGAGSEKAGALQDSVAQKLSEAGARLAQIRADAIGQANLAVRATDQYVQENPWLAVGMVAAMAGMTGLIAGFVIGRR